MDTCRICGARLFDGTGYCSRCYAPVVPTSEEIAAAEVELAAAGGVWQPPPKPMDPWRPDARHTAETAPAVVSRWRAGDLSFSTPVKIVITVAVGVGVPVGAVVFGGAFGVWLVGVWSVAVTPRVVKDLWRYTRIS